VIGRVMKKWIVAMGVIAASHSSVLAGDVADIHAYLFYEHTGTWSKDIIGTEAFVLWNTLIGGGDVQEPANSFLVDIEFHRSKDVKADYFLVVTERDSGKTIYTEKFKLGLFGDKNVWHKAAFIRDHVCAPLRVTVRSKEQSLRSEEINFRCGE
jgi:hypothetical protein